MSHAVEKVLVFAERIGDVRYPAPPPTNFLEERVVPETYFIEGDGSTEEQYAKFLAAEFPDTTRIVPDALDSVDSQPKVQFGCGAQGVPAGR